MNVVRLFILPVEFVFFFERVYLYFSMNKLSYKMNDLFSTNIKLSMLTIVKSLITQLTFFAIL